MEKALRFFQIDLQYLSIKKIPIDIRIKNILATNIAILKNLLIRPKKFSPVTMNGKKIMYDTPFATKSLLVGTYDFYCETKKLTIFTNNPVVVDVGANLGQYLFAIKTFLPKAKVYSFEPSQNVNDLLRYNAKNYSSVHIYNVALSDKSGKTTFYVNRQFSTWSTINPLEKHNYDKIIVKTQRGDTLLRKLSHIDLLKVDVERFELKVLKGMEKSLKISKYLLIEITLSGNPDDPGATKLIKFILESKFNLIHIGRIFSKGPGEYQSAVNMLFRNSRM